jgi:hypothetical protein
MMWFYIFPEKYNKIKSITKNEGLIILIKGTVESPDRTIYLRLQIRRYYFI